MKPRPKKNRKLNPTKPTAAPSLREQILADFTTLRIPVTADQLDAALTDAEKSGRFYARHSLLIIDEFGFDRIERSLCPQAASLWYKIIDARSQRVSTALVTNIDFESWADYLGDAPLAMALLDRVVDGATIVKLKGKSYRVHRGSDSPSVK